MVDLPEIDAGEQNRVIDEFFHNGSGKESDDGATVTFERSAARPTAPVVNARVERERLEREADDEPIPFRFLHEAKAHKLTQLLAGEHPQTIALVISHLGPDQASEVLAPLPVALAS